MDEPPQKRFRYTSYNEQLSQISIDVGKRKGLSWEKDDYADEDQTSTPLVAELDRLALHDLTLPYQQLSQTLRPLTRTLPITLHNLPQISSILSTFFQNLSDGHEHTDSGLGSALSLLQALTETCLGETLPFVPDFVRQLTRVGALRALDPKHVERTYSTLSLVLRVVAPGLLKPDNVDNLRQSWTAVHRYLSPETKSYVRQCISDAWSGVIRKARSDALQQLLAVLFETPLDGMEAIWFNSMKGTANHLHSRALPIFSALLDHLEEDPSERSLATLRAVVTALIHHCSSSSATPLVEAVIGRITSTASPAMIDILSTFLFVRKGKRFPKTQLKPAMTKLQSLIPQIKEHDEEWRRALVACVAGTLTAGQLAEWLSPGVSMIDALWNALTTTEAYAFVNMLVSLKWEGIEQFLLPHVAKVALPELVSNTLSTLELLNNLAAAGYLSGGLLNVQGGRWRQGLISSLATLCSKLSQTAQLDVSDRRILGQILALVSSLPGTEQHFASPLVCILLRIVDKAEGEDEWRESGSWNDSHLIARLLKCTHLMAVRGATGIKEALFDRVESMATSWAWNREVLNHVASFIELWEVKADTTPLLGNILSADSLQRSSTLRILAVQNSSPVWKLCLNVESAEMTLKNVRDRPTQIARLSRHLASEPFEPSAMTYLVSQLKVNFRPVYAEAISALTAIASEHGDELWTLLWSQLERTLRAKSASAPDLETELPSWSVASSDREEQEDDDEQIEYRCTALNKSTRIVQKAWKGAMVQDDADEIQSQIPDDHLDVLNYEAQLVATLTSLHSLAEKHTRVLVPVVLAVAGSTEDPAVVLGHLSTRQLQQRTSNFLELFAKFANPKAAFRSEELHTLYLSLLAKGDTKVQDVALRCLLTYKSPKLKPYQESLHNLLDDSKFRDELAHLNLGTDSDVIDPQDRVELIPVVIRVLYGIMTSRRGRSSTQGQAARKQAVLTSLSGCAPEELSTLVQLMLLSFGEESTAGRRQLGFLTLLNDVLRYLGPQTVPYWPELLNNAIGLIQNAQQRLGADVSEEDEEESNPAPLRSIRSTGLKRLVQFVRMTVEFDLTPFLPAIYSVIIPRLDKLEIENTQAPSGTLDLIAALAASDFASSLVRFDDRVLPKTFACMTAVKVKPAVIGRVFDIVESLVESPELLVHIDSLLDQIIGLIETHENHEDIMKRLLGILSRLSTIVQNGEQAQRLATLLGPMLRMTGRKMPEKAKIDILSTLRQLYAISPDFADPSSKFFAHNYDLISNLFQSLYLPASRRAVCSTFETFASSDQSLETIASVVSDLNAYSKRRLDEPDFDLRLDAFAKIIDGLVTPASAREWLPILRSALFFIQEPEELSIRTNSSAVLQRFISSFPADDWIQFALIPALRRILRSKVELVRNEVLLVLSHAVKTSETAVLIEMRPLLGDDDETNIFINIGHIQVHRRARALRRLCDVLGESAIRETTLSSMFVPLLEHILAGSTDVTDHHLVNEAINTTGSLAKHLSWSRYSALISRFLRLGSAKTPQQKFYVRAISAIIDNFHFDLDQTIGKDDEDSDDEDVVPAPNVRVVEAITNRILPALNTFVSNKDETEESIRIPLALGVVKLAYALPNPTNEVVRIVTTASQILRSKDQDTRDTARDTIGKIAVFLGPGWLVRVIGELRTALQRGPQKHVLAVTVHSILVQASEAGEKFGDLDEAIEDAVDVSAEAIWGESGKDAATEGYKTKMREVRGATSRANDTFQLLARLVSPSKLGALLAPVREIMHASQAVKTMQQVDEVLRRISLGLNANERLNPGDVLALCHSLINGNSRYLAPKKKQAKAKTDRFHVQMKRDDKAPDDVYPQNAHKFVTFGLDLFITAFRRGKFDFDDVDILSRLGPLVGAIGNTLYSPTSSVLILGLKATAAIVRCPIPQVDAALPTFVSNVFKVIKQAGGTAESEVAQTALKTLAVIMRDCKASQVTDNQLKYLIEIISPDLEDHDRQSAIFTVLRAVVARQFMVPEIYDLMERVSSIIVTSQSTHVQELCRGVLIQFLLDYPQGAERLKAQMTFLARNLDYIFESGRVSVMELLAAVLSKFSDEIIAVYADLFFVALVAVLANDDSEKCRGMAKLLIHQLFERLGEKQQAKTVAVLDSWISGRQDNAVLAGSALAVFALLADLTSHVPDISSILEESAALLEDAEATEDAVVLDHNLPHQALVLATKVVKGSPLPWDAIIAHLLFPHDWVRIGAARTLSALFSTGTAFETLDDDDLLDIAKKSCILLGGSESEDGEIVVDTKLADQLVKLLWNVAKHWTASQPSKQAVDGEEEDEESEEPVKSPMAWLMSRMSFLARRLVIKKSQLATWTGPVMAILRFFAGVYEHLSSDQATRFLVHVLSPIYRILDEGGDLAGVDGLDELCQLATEVRDFVQSKVGTTDFSRTWDSLRRKTTEKREDRRDARNRLAISNPKAWAERKGKRSTLKKESKKRKVNSFMDKRRGKK